MKSRNLLFSTFLQFKTVCSFAPLALVLPSLVTPVNASESGNAGMEVQNDINALKIERIKNAALTDTDEINTIKSLTDKKSLDNKQEVVKNEVKVLLKAVRFSGNTKFTRDQLLKYFNDLIGTKVSFSELLQATNKIQNLYRNKGYITSRAILPKQDFRSGYVRISILESFIEDIIIQGGSKGSQSYVKYMTSSILEKNNKNNIFKFDDLERQLLLIRKSGIASITSTLSKGTQEGGSILTIQINDNPASSALFADSNLSEKLGDYQIGLKSSYTTKSSKPIKISASGKYAFPVKDGLTSGIALIEKPLADDGLSVSALYAYTKSNTKDLFPETSGESVNKGESEYISLAIAYPITLKRNSEIGIDLSTTIQNSSTDLYLDNVRSNNVSTDLIRAIRLGISGRKNLKRSYNLFRFEVAQGIDGWDNSLATNEYKSNLDAEANFTKYKLDLTRRQYFGNKGVNVLFQASGQTSSTPLPTPEKFSFGGSAIGRGFKNSHIFGDAGWASSIKLAKDIYLKKGKGAVSPYVWYDYGSTSDFKSTDGEITASTYGLGLNGNIKQNTTYDLSIGVPSTDDSASNKTGIDHAIFGFSLGYSF